MTGYIYFTFYIALTAVYLLFLFRVRQGLRYLHAHPVAPPPDDQLPGMTVIVPVRNEESTIAGCVASLTAQAYPSAHVEFLIVDDHSTDATAEAAGTAIGNDVRFRLLRLSPESGQGKKAAVTLGVREARFPVIVTTDADCTHASGWLRSLAALHASGAEVVAGPVVVGAPASLFGRLQALEFLGLVGVGAGLFGVGYPRLCNGANFSYRRELFAKAGGYAGNENVPSGDDEFLLHAMVYGLGRRADFAATPDACAFTPAAPTARAFLSQRVRWASKGRKYADRRFVAFLAVLFAYLAVTAAAPLMWLVSPGAGAAALAMLLVKLVADVSVLIPTAAMLQRPLRGMDILIAELFHAPYLVLVSFLGLFGTYSWKQRKFRGKRS